MKSFLCVLVVSIVSIIPAAYPAQAKGVEIFTALDRPYVLADCEQEVVLKVGLRADSDIKNTERPALNLAIVLDKSGSMGSDQKMEKAKQGLYEIIERLNEGDIISVVVYDTEPRVLIPAQVLKNKEMIIERVSQISASGSTALYAGVELGAQELRKYISDYCLNKIILLSDGLANVGPQSTEDLASFGRMLELEDIIVSTIGVGLDYNEDLMTALAAESGGNSYFAKEASELPRIFAEEINEAVTVLAKNIKIHIDTEGEVIPLGIIGRDGVFSDKSFETEINALYGKNEKYALFEIKVPQATQATSRAIANVRVEYTEPDTGKIISVCRKINVQYHKDADFVRLNEDKNILKETALTKTSKIKNEAIKLADAGKYDAAADYLTVQSTVLEKAAQQCNNDKEVQEEAKRLSWLSENILSNKGFSRGLRKSVVSEAYSQTNQQYYDPGRERKNQ